DLHLLMSTSYQYRTKSLIIHAFVVFFFFFQAEDGIRDWSVTGVQTCALPISKMEAGMMTYHLQPASLASVIDRAVTELGPLAEAKRIKIEARIREPIPLVKMDPARNLPALRNLVGNAGKFTPDGGRVTLQA